MLLSNLEEREGAFSDSSGFHYGKHTTWKGRCVSCRERGIQYPLGGRIPLNSTERIFP